MREAEIVLARDVFAPGEAFNGRVVVRCDKPFTCKSATLRFFGRERTEATRGTGKQRRVYVEEKTPTNETVALSEPREIPAGESIFNFSLRVPPEAPGTYNGTNGKIGYVLKAEFEIPWALNLDCSRPIYVAWVAPPVPSQPRTGVISREGIPVVNIELQGDLIEPGGTVMVRFVVAADVKCRGLRLQIRDCEMVAPHGYRETAERTVAEAYYPIGDLHANLWYQQIFTTDRNLCPSFRSELIDFTHSLKASLDIAMGFDESVTLPLRSAAYYREVVKKSA